MAKKQRHYVPCRECGKEHTNPASSSICNECGPAYAAKNREAKEHERLYDILTDHFMYCEEDSWEKGQDLDDWTTEQMAEYKHKYIG